MLPGITEAQTVNHGIKGGLTTSNLYIDIDDLDDENARTGFHVGVYSQYVLGGVGIQPEVLFTTKGSEAEFTGIIDQSVSFNMSYIDVPVLLTLRPFPFIEIHAGPYAGFLVHTNIQFEGTIEGETELDRDHFRTVDLGLSGGVAFNLAAVQIGARYNLGLTEIAESNAAQVLLGDSKHQYLQVYLALRFPGR